MSALDYLADYVTCKRSKGIRPEDIKLPVDPLSFHDVPASWELNSFDHFPEDPELVHLPWKKSMVRGLNLSWESLHSLEEQLYPWNYIIVNFCIVGCFAMNSKLVFTFSQDNHTIYNPSTDVPFYYADCPALIPGVADGTLALVIPIIGYWTLSLFFHGLDISGWQ